MLYSSQSTQPPAEVKVEQCPDRTIVWLTDNVQEIQTEDQTVYQYDEVQFDLPEDREETEETIAENFDEWWLYGQEDHTEPTLEERVSIIEDILMEM